MPYESRQEREDAKWMRVRDALQQIMQADRCDLPNAKRQLSPLIRDHPVVLRKKPMPWASRGGPTSPQRTEIPLRVQRWLIDRHWPLPEDKSDQSKIAETEPPQAQQSKHEQGFDLVTWYRDWLPRNQLASEANVMKAAQAAGFDGPRRLIRALRANPDGTPLKRGCKPGKTQAQIRQMAGELAK